MPRRADGERDFPHKGHTLIYPVPGRYNHDMLSQSFRDRLHTIDNTPLAFKLPLVHGRAHYSKSPTDKEKVINLG